MTYLLDLFSRMDSHCLPSEQTTKEVIKTMAHKAVSQEPRYIIDCFSHSLKDVQLNPPHKANALCLCEQTTLFPFFGSDRLSWTLSTQRINSSLCEADSDHGSIGNNDVLGNDILPNILRAVKTVGPPLPAEAPAPVEGVSQPSASVPAAADCLQMLRKAWINPIHAP